MDRVEPFSFLATPQALLRSRTFARAALLCLLLATLTTLAHAGTVVDSTRQEVNSAAANRALVVLGDS